MSWRTYNNTTKIKARKVNKKGGEDVVTPAGIAHAEYNSYIVLDENSAAGTTTTRILSREDFEKTYAAPRSKSPSPRDTNTPVVKAGETPDTEDSVKARVEAAKRERNAS